MSIDDIRSDSWSIPPNDTMSYDGEQEGVDYYLCVDCGAKVYYDSGLSPTQQDCSVCKACAENYFE